MNKKFFANGYAWMACIAVFLVTLALGMFLIINFEPAKNDGGLLVGVSVCFIIVILFLYLILFHCWVVEISEQGILYRNFFKFRKFKRFFSWEEIDEIEIIKLRVLNLKQTYFTRLHYSYGHKRFINMKDPDVIILNTASKKIQEEIKKHYSKNIITGRTFKIAIAQEEYEEQEK